MRDRKDRAPKRMSMQDRASTRAAHNGEMKQGFGGRSAIAEDNIHGIVHFQKLRGTKAALVEARRGYRHPQRLARSHRAEVPTRPQNPSAQMKSFSNLRQESGCLRERSAFGVRYPIRPGAVPACPHPFGF